MPFNPFSWKALIDTIGACLTRRMSINSLRALKKCVKWEAIFFGIFQSDNLKV